MAASPQARHMQDAVVRKDKPAHDDQAAGLASPAEVTALDLWTQ